MHRDLALIKFVVAKNKLPRVTPARFPSGVINRVYDLGNCVIKIEGSDETDYAKGVVKPQAGVISKLVSLGAKVPKIVDHGEFESHPYLLMEKVRGKNLVYDWLAFSMPEKENIIEQLCEQLKIFHSIKIDHYSLPIYLDHKFENLKDALANVTNFNLIDKMKLKKEYVEDIEFLEEFFAENISLLDEQNTAVLTHNDIHLENIFYEQNKITGIIDFDWVAAAPKDYELWKMTDVFYDPKKTVEQGLESLYDGYRMTEEFKFVKKYYPQLFEAPNLLTRVRLFHLENMLYKVTDFQKGRWSEDVLKSLHTQIDDFFRQDWLEKLLSYNLLKQN